MASGKSTIGKKLANNLNLPFIDLDKVFENNQETTIRLYMYKYGEDAFRKIEKEMLEKVINENKNAVISTGGGTPCFFNNMQLMNSCGITVYLEVDTPTLVNRLMHSKIDRPLVWGKTKADLTGYAKNLLEKRNEFYSQAKYKVNGKNLTVNNLVTLIKTEL